MDFAADLPFFYAEFGVEAVHTNRLGVTSGPELVLFNQPGMMLLSSEVLATDLSIQYPAASFPVVRKDDTFLIAGKTYQARENHQPTEDGVEYIVPLKKV